jgi:hypothetical protein
MHSVDKAQTLANAAFGKRSFDLRSDVDVGTASLSAKNQLLAVCFHGNLLLIV